MWSYIKKSVVVLKTAILITATQQAIAGDPIPETDFTIPQGAYTANFIEDRDHIAIMEFAGNYNRNLTDGSFNQAARAVVAQEFYANHADNYDFLVVFSSFEFDTGDATAFHLGVRNDTQGIGKPIFDNSARYGSAGVLQSYIDMAAISRYELNPLKPGFEQVLNILGHETLHRWASSVSFLDEQGNVRTDLLGRDNAHWNFFLDTDASLEYGHQWQDNGDGTFSAVSARRFFSPLDLYLMGFYTPQQVPPMQLLSSATTEFSATDLPSPGARIEATAEIVSIENIISHEGPRAPAASDSQKEFRFAFVYLTTPGATVDDSVLRRLNDVRRSFVDRFAIWTGGQGVAQVYPQGVPAADIGQAEPLQNTSPIATDPVTVSDALAWLNSQQQSAGNWEDKPATRIRDTAVAFTTLNDLDLGFVRGLDARTWLLQQPVDNNDSLARIVEAIGDTASTAALVDTQNSDGGWGLRDGFESNPLDTALAVNALAKRTQLTSPQTQSRVAGINYLMDQLNPSGYWSAVVDGPANLRATLAAIFALKAIDMPVENVLPALNWMASQQNGDGSFGSDEGNVHETAQTIIALLNYEQNDLIDLDSAIVYIQDQQRAAGHWDGSVYTTALAATAIQSVALPNLILQSITTNAASYRDGERIKLSALVSNDSALTPPATDVQFYLGDPNNGGVALGSPQTIIGVPPNTSVVVEYYWDSLNLAGTQQIFAVVDPDNIVSERSERDNTASLELTIDPAPSGIELEVTQTDIQISPSAISQLPTPASFSASVRNFGLTDAVNVEVDLQAAGAVVGNEFVTVPARSSAVVNFVVDINTPGITELILNADPNGLIVEENKTNNVATTQVATLDSLDIGIAIADVGLAATVNLHEDVAVPITIHNFGTVSSPNTNVRISLVDASGSRELQTINVIIEPGQFVQRELLWRPDVSGTVNFIVEIDPDNLVAEADEANNVISVPVEVQSAQGANLSLSFRDLTFNPNPALEGLGVTLGGKLLNNGTQELTSVELAFYDGNPTTGGQQVGSLITVPSISPGEQLDISTVWPEVLNPIERTIYLYADPNNLITELDETDNLVFDSLSVESLPDLTLSSSNVTANPQFPRQDESVEITVTVNNLGRQEANDVLVRLYQDGSEVGSGQVISVVPGTGAATALFTTTFTTTGDHTLSVAVDPDNAIRESNEQNNNSERLLAVQDGSFYVTERYISPDGNNIKDSSEYFFRLSNPEQVEVQVIDKRDRVVRSFPIGTDPVSSGSVNWDGRNSLGVIVADGEYRFAVVNQQQQIIGQTYVIVDTNRSSLVEAIGTPFALNRNLSCSIGEIYNSPNSPKNNRYWNNFENTSWIQYSEEEEIVYSPDGEQIYFATYLEPYIIDSVVYRTDDNVKYPSGLYRALNDGTSVSLLAEHGAEFTPEDTFNVFGLRAIVPSSDGSKLALLMFDPVEVGEGGIGAKILILDLQTNTLTKLWERGRFERTELLALTGLQFGRNDSELYFAQAYYNETILTKIAVNGLSAPTDILTVDISAYNNSEYSYSLDRNSPDIYFNASKTHLVLYHPTQSYGPGSRWFYGGEVTKEAGLAHLIDVDSENSVLLGDEIGSISWSPNGQVLAVGDPTSLDFIIYDLNGSIYQRVPLPHQMPDSARDLLQPLFNYDLSNRIWGRIDSISWSTDGTELAFTFEDYLDSALAAKTMIGGGGGGYGGSEEFNFISSLLADINNEELGKASGIYLLNLENSELQKAAILEPTAFVECWKFNCNSYYDNERILEENDFGILVDQQENLPYLIWAPNNWQDTTPWGRNKKLEWLTGSRTVLISGNTGNVDEHPIVLDLNDPAGETQEIFKDKLIEEFSHVSPSPTGKLLRYTAQDQCTESTLNRFQFQSLLNLSLDLKAIRSPKAGGVILKGTASDKNFQAYQLEYASVDTPNNWVLLTPRSEDLVIDDQFTVWASPDIGNYYVRLTGYDLAGNQRSEVKQVAITESASISNLLRQPAIISPNGDGVQDSVDMSFIVRSEVNLKMDVLNDNGTIVRTYENAFDIIGANGSFVWDGRNGNGIVVPDGTYTLKLQNYEFFVDVDNTPPVIIERTKNLKKPPRLCGLTPCPISLDIQQIAEAGDLNAPPSLILQKRHELSQDWQAVDIQSEFREITDSESQLHTVYAEPKFSYEDLAINSYRWVSTDLAGNTTVEPIPDTLKRQKLYLIASSEEEVFDEVPLGGLIAEDISLFKGILDTPNPRLSTKFGPLSFIAVETIYDELQSVEMLYRPFPSGQQNQESFLSSGVTHYWRPIDCSEGTDTSEFDRCRSILSNNIDDRNDHYTQFYWDPELAGLDKEITYELLLKVTTQTGDEFFSNNAVLIGERIVLAISDKAEAMDAITFARFGDLNLLRPNASKGLRFNTSIPWEETAEIHLSVSSTEDKRYLVNTHIDTIIPTEDNHKFIKSDSLNPDLFQYMFDVSDFQQCKKYNASVVIYTKSGSSFDVSNVVSSTCLDVKEYAYPVIPESCNAPATNTVRIELTPLFPVDFGDTLAAIEKQNTTLSTLIVYAQDPSTGEFLDVLSNWNEPNFDQVYSLDLDMQPYFGEGDKLNLLVQLIDTNGRSAERGIEIPIVEAPPEINITYPLIGQQICASPVVPTNEDLGPYNGILMQGSIDSNQDFMYRVLVEDQLSFCGEQQVSILQNRLCLDGDGNTRENFIEVERAHDSMPKDVLFGVDEIPLSTARGRLDPVSGLNRIRGDLAFPKMQGVGDREVTLEAYNWSGAKVCRLVEFEIDAEVEGYSADLTANNFIKPRASIDFGGEEKPLSVGVISPNADGVFDDFSIDIFVDESVTATLEVYNTTDDISFVVVEDHFATPIDGLVLNAGSSVVSWDGTNDNGQVVPDGHYVLQLIVEDACGLIEKRLFAVEVDNTPPLTDISYPLQNDPISLIVEVIGSVSDKNIEIAYLDLNRNNQSIRLASRNRNITDDILYAWNTFGLEGEVTLVLTAQDKLGNESFVANTFVIPERQDLISDYNLLEPYVSPNNDQTLDTAVVRTRFERPVVATFEVLSNGQVIRTIESGTEYGAEYVSIEWDGLNDNGSTVPDGKYTIRVRAEDSQVQGFTQTESVSVIYDVTPPEIQLPELVDGYLELNNELLVNGSISDLHFKNYSVDLTTSSTGLAGILLIESNDLPANSVLELDEFTFSTDGEYDFEFSATDLAGNVTKLPARLVIDSTPPVVSINSPESNLAFSSTVGSLSIEGFIEEDNLKVYQLFVAPSNAPEQLSLINQQNTLPVSSNLGSWDISSVEEGAYILTLVAQNRAGISTQTKINVNIDNTPPDVIIDQPSEQTYITELEPITGTATDENFLQYSLAIATGFVDNSAVYSDLLLNNQEVSNSSLLAWTQLPEDGEYTLRLRASDTAENVAEIYRQFIIDTQPPAKPVMTEVSLDRDVPSVQTQWEPNSESDLVGYILYRNGNPITGTVTEINFDDTGVVEGNYSYAVSAIDLAGLESELSDPLEIRVDLTPPTTSLSQPSPSQVVSGLVNIRGTAHSLDDFKEYRVFIGEAGSDLNLIRASSVPLLGDELAQWDTLGLPESQDYTIRLEAEDLDGNVGSVEISVVIDNLPPEAPVNLQGSPTGADVDISWEYLANTADVAGYLLYRNGRLANVEGVVIGDVSPYILSNLTFDDDALPDGEFKYSVYAIDEAGNISPPSEEITVNLDNRPPHAVISSFENDHNFENTLFLSTEQEDLDIAEVVFQYRLPGDSVWQQIEVIIGEAPYEYIWDTTSLAYGTYEITVIATDRNNNVDPAPEVLTIDKVDLTPPGQVQGLTSIVSGDQIQLSWTPNTDIDLQDYYVERSTSNDNAWITVGNTLTNSYTDSAPDGLYDYRIIATDDVDNYGDPSDISTNIVFTPNIDSLMSPTLEETTVLSGSTEVGATVEVILDNTSGVINLPSLVADNGGLFSSEIVTLLSGENTFFVTAQHPVYTSTSNQVSVIVDKATLPSKPIGLTANFDSIDNDIDLAWQANPVEENISGYVVYRDGDLINPVNSATIDFAIATQNTSRIANIIDSNFNSYWWTHVTNPEPYFGVQLTEPQLVTEIEVYYRYQDYAANAYDVEIWNGSQWVNVLSVDNPRDFNTPQTQVIKLDRIYNTDRIRVVPRETYRGWVYVGDFEVRTIELEATTSYSDIPTDGFHDYEISAINFYGYEGPKSDPANVAFGDVEAPGPVILSSITDASTVDLNWTTALENDISFYTLYRDGDAIAQVNANGVLTYLDGPLQNGTYNYYVTVTDLVGNESIPSNTEVASINVPVLPAPINLSAILIGENTDVSLAWEPGLNSTPSGYNIYRAENSGANFIFLASSASTAYVDTDTQLQETYSYHIRAFDELGNESATSNVVTIFVEDVIEPLQPLISAPTTSSDSFTTEKVSESISGSAEPGSEVYLIQDGRVNPLSVTASADLQFNSLEEQYVYQFIGNNLGQVIFIGESFDCCEYSLNLFEDGRVTPIFTFVEDVYEWSENYIWVGDKVLALIETRSDDVLLLIDPATQTFTEYNELPFDFLGSFELFGYDETLENLYFYINQFGNAEDYLGTYQYNIRSGALELIYDSRPEFLTANLKHIVDDNFNVSTQELTIETYDLVSQQPKTLILPSVSSYSFNASNQSTSGATLAILIRDSSGEDRIAVYDIENDSIEYIETNADVSRIVWDVDKRLGYVGYSNTGDEFNFYVYDLNSKTTTLAHNFSEINDIGDAIWTKDQHLLFGAETENDYLGLLNYFAPGRFAFDDVSLNLGENIFSAFAVDSAGNLGVDSSPINIIRAQSNLPDLTIDIEAVPLIGVVGKDLVLNMLVRNDGNTISPIPEYSLSLFDEDGNETVLENNQSGIAIAPGLSFNREYTWRPPTSGDYTVVAKVDSENSINELSELNNTAILDLPVTESPVPVIDLTLAFSAAGNYQFEPAALLVGSSRFLNSLESFTGSMEISVRDENDAQVEQLLSTNFEDVNYGYEAQYPLQWNSDSIYPGNYQLVARLYDEDGGLLAEEAINFAIISRLSILSSLLTDRSAYGPNTDVNVEGLIANSGGNRIFAGGFAEFVITRDTGSVVYSVTRQLGELLPGETTTSVVTWNTELTSSGNYQVVLEIKDRNNQLLSSANSEFTVLVGNPNFIGTLSLAEDRIPGGSLIQASYAVSNQTNASVSGVELQVNLLDPVTQNVVSTQTTNFDFNVGDIQSSIASLSTDSLNLGSYDINLISTVSVNGQVYRQELARRSLTIFDANPPELTINTPNAGSIINWMRNDLSATAIDSDSGVDFVEVRFDDGEWFRASRDEINSQRYFTGITDLADGPHRADVRATDNLGNRSNNESANFIVDTLPPDIIIEGIESGVFYGDLVSPVINVTDLHLANVEILVDGEIFNIGDSISSDGEHIFSVTATDAADNFSQSIVLFEIDTTGALIEIEGVTDLGLYNHPVTPVITIVEENAVNTVIHLNGTPYISGTELSQEGSYTLLVEVTDAANNVSTEQIEFSIDLTPPPVPVITSHQNGETVTSDIVTLVGSTEGNAVVSILLTDGTEISVIADNQGVFSISDVSLLPGENSFSLSARDRAGNDSPSSAFGLNLQSAPTTELTGYYDRLDNRVLVWLPEKDRHAHPHCGLFSHSGHSGHYHRYGHDEEALHEDIVQALSSQNIGYYVARSEREFVKELRSQKYTTVLFARLRKTSHFSDKISGSTLLELRGMIASGLGLVVINTENSAIPALRDILGAKITKPIYNSGTLVLEDSIATTAGSFTLGDTRGVKVKLQGGMAVGQIEYDCWKNSSYCTQPAVVLNRYGNGDVAFLPFNPSAIEDENVISDLLLGLINFAKPDAATNLPGSLVEIQWDAAPLSPPQDLLFVQNLPSDLKNILAIDGEVITDQHAEWERHIETSESTLFKSLVRLPETGGEHTITSKLYDLSGQNPVLIVENQLLVAINKDLETLETELIALLEEAESNAGYKKGIYRLALYHIQRAIDANKQSKWSLDHAIYHLEMAIYKLHKVKELELLINTGELLRTYQSEWYEHASH